MAWKNTAILLLLSISTFGLVASATDRTLEDRASGQEVVEACVDKVKGSGIFDYDLELLFRISFVGCKFGEETSTFTGPTRHGIWQLSEKAFNFTKTNERAKALHSRIQSYFGIDWGTLEVGSLLKPLHSCICARLYLVALGKVIPQTKAEQADFWASYYNSNDKLSKEDFIRGTEELENKYTPCRGKMDLCVILDGSGSIGSDNFFKAKKFVADLLASFSDDREMVRKSCILFSTETLTYFNFDNQLTKDEMNGLIVNAKYPDGTTNTNRAILEAWKLFMNCTVREGVPRVQTLFTDGGSTDGEKVSNVKYTKAGNISSYALGIGSSTNPQELLKIALDDPTHVLSAKDYSSLSEVTRRLNSVTCTEPQTPSNNGTCTDKLVKGEKRYYRYTIPEIGLKISLSLSVGSLGGCYWSYNFNKPNGAVHDGEIAGSGTTRIPCKAKSPRALRIGFREGTDNTVYLAIQGKEDSNEYSIQAVPGSTLRAAPVVFLLLCSILFNAFK